MKIRNIFSGGLAETDDAQAKRLIAAGGWESAEPKKAPAKKAAPKKAAPKDTTEE